MSRKSGAIHAELEERSRRWLVKAHADKFRNLTNPQKALINAVTGIRNHIAHRSHRSGEAMNNLLAVGALHNIGIKRGANKIKNVGAWLKATPQGRVGSRIETMIAAQAAIGLAC